MNMGFLLSLSYFLNLCKLASGLEKGIALPKLDHCRTDI